MSYQREGLYLSPVNTQGVREQPLFRENPQKARSGTSASGGWRMGRGSPPWSARELDAEIGAQEGKVGGGVLWQWTDPG